MTTEELAKRLAAVCQRAQERKNPGLAAKCGQCGKPCGGVQHFRTVGGVLHGPLCWDHSGLFESIETGLTR